MIDRQYVLQRYLVPGYTESRTGLPKQSNVRRDQLSAQFLVSWLAVCYLRSCPTSVAFVLPGKSSA